MDTRLSKIILESSIKISKDLGLGLLESVYQTCLQYELQKQNIKCEKEVILPVCYYDLKFQSGFRADLIVEDKIIIEVKSLEKMSKINKAQILTYLKLTKYPLGLLINFGEDKVVDGFHRFANGAEAENL
jgi:GxxExxY protein